MRASDVLLLTAVPCDEAAFRRAWDERSDLLRGAYVDVEEGWRAFARTAAVARALLGECAELGATVVRDATLDHLAAGMRSFPVVTLIAHMEFPRVSPDDVLNAAAFQRLVRHAPEPEWEWIRSECAGSGGMSEAVAAMNRVLEASRRDVMAAPIKNLREAARVVRQRSGAFGLLRVDRPRLDELCGPAVLRPGRGVELANGMVTAAEFIGAIPHSYDGFLDLRLCNSIALGAAIRRARSRIHLAVGKRRTYVEVALVLCKTALAVMRQRSRGRAPISYQDALMAVRTEVT